MEDWLDSIGEYRKINEFYDLYEDALKLRCYHNSCQFAEMMNHIRLLVMKYPVEAGAWNTVNTVRIPNSDYEQHFRTADKFLETVAKERLAFIYCRQVYNGGVSKDNQVY